MRQLLYQIPAANICLVIHLRANLNNEIRWSSTYHMLQRYIDIEHHIPQLCLPDLDGVCLTSSELDDIKALCKTFGELDNLTVKLKES